MSTFGDDPARPKLRAVDRYPLEREGTAMIVLRDPHGISESIAVDAEFSAVLDALDGRRTLPQIRQSLLLMRDLDVPLPELAEFVADLRDAGWLDDETFRLAWEAAYTAYMESDARPSIAEGVLYPADPRALSDALAVSRGPCTLAQGHSDVLGVVTPRLPLAQISGLLAKTLVGLPTADEVELLLVLSTDYAGGLLPFSLTDKDTTTALGLMHTDIELVDELDTLVPWIRREELRHRHADGIELVALLARAIWGDRTPPALPLLCGRGALEADHEHQRDEILAALERVAARRRVFLWVCAELTHIGPAYGGDPLPDQTDRAVEAYDRHLLARLQATAPERFAHACREGGAYGRPSGGAALDVAARILPIGHSVELADYRVISVDTPQGDRGLVGACGIRWLAPRGTTRP